jgi:hypothetical protein
LSAAESLKTFNIRFSSKADVLLCTLLSVVTFGLFALSALAMYYITSSSNITHSDVPRYWTETSIGVFLGIVVKSLSVRRLIRNILITSHVRAQLSALRLLSGACFADLFASALCGVKSMLWLT